MLQHYASPVLLIEFDQNKAFTFESFTSSTAASTPSSYIPDNATSFVVPSFASSNLISPANPRSAQHLLVLLTLAFPRLKIIWSSSPYQTAEIFAELKKSNPEPDPVRAVQIGLDFELPSGIPGQVGVGSSALLSATGVGARIFNQLPQDMLRAVPGVTPQLLERLILETKNIHQIANMEVEELSPLVGKEVARKIVRFFRRSVFEDEEIEK
jgi:DNA excision repair protein ERCC-4